MKVLITGGTGFIGSNAAARFIERGDKVILFDNLSRKGADANLKWLQTVACGLNHRLNFVKGDIRDYRALCKLFHEYPDIQVVLHLASQVAVTTSVINPREDFEVNALGTLNLLEAIRNSKAEPIVLFASTNKVYGSLENIEVIERETRYEYKNPLRGISEEQPLDFHSPYGCSKGAADQYVRDYYRIYGLRTVVFRQSCIYGYRQFGVEDQGWVAWFLIASLFGRPITIYGNGKQVRDVLFIDDLIDAYLEAIEQIHVTAGQVYNIGGGPENTISIWQEFYPLLEKFVAKDVKVNYAAWRPGDQRVFICDISKAKRDFGFSPKTSVEDGIRKLYGWIIQNRSLFEESEEI